MAKLNLGNVQNVEENDFTLLPEGVYNVRVKKADVKTATLNPNNEMVAITFEVISGEYKGRQLFTNYNIKNENEQAQSIGIRNLQLLAKHSGLQALDDTDDLLNKEVSVDVCIRKGKDGYQDRNDVKKSYPLNGGAEEKKETAPWNVGGWGK